MDDEPNTGSAFPDRLSEIAADAPMMLRLADLSAPPRAGTLRWLGDREHERAARFRQDRDRSRYLAAHVALRLFVDRCCGISPRRQRYEQDRQGAWRLAGQSTWRLSMSYAGDVALLAISRDHAIGVDLETDRVVEDAGELAALHFDQAERSAYDAQPARDRDRAFLRGWTRKEACLKAIGTGLRLAPATVHTGLDGACRTVLDGREVDLSSFEANGRVAAWAIVR